MIAEDESDGEANPSGRLDKRSPQKKVSASIWSGIIPNGELLTSKIESNFFYRKSKKATNLMKTRTAARTQM